MAKTDGKFLSSNAAQKECDSGRNCDQSNPVPIEVRFGMRVHALRIERRLPQEVLAFRSQVHRNYISDVERGKRNVSLRIIERLANALDVEIAELFKNMD